MYNIHFNIYQISIHKNGLDKLIYYINEIPSKIRPVNFNLDKIKSHIDNYLDNFKH